MSVVTILSEILFVGVFVKNLESVYREEGNGEGREGGWEWIEREGEKERGREGRGLNMWSHYCIHRWTQLAQMSG